MNAVVMASSTAVRDITFSNGRASFDIPVEAGEFTKVETHVVPPSTLFSEAYVFEILVNDTSDPSFQPRIEATSVTAAPFESHVRLSGLEPGTTVTAKNRVISRPSGPIDVGPDGRATVAAPLDPALENYIDLDFAAPGGRMKLFVRIDGLHVATELPPAPGIPAAPGVEVEALSGGRTDLELSGEASAVVTVRNASGREVAGTQLVQGAGRITLPTPPNETLLTVTQTVDNAESEAADVVLSPGLGSRLPSATTTTAVRSKVGLVLTITGEAGAVVRVSESGGRLVALRAVGAGGRAQVIAPASTPGPLHVTQSRGGETSKDETLPLP